MKTFFFFVALEQRTNALFRLEAQPKPSAAEEKMSSLSVTGESTSATHFRDMVRGGGTVFGWMSTRLNKNQCEAKKRRRFGKDEDKSDEQNPRRSRFRLRLNFMGMAQIWSPREQQSLVKSQTLPRGTLTPTTGATAAERRVFDGAGTDPPESGSSGSEREIRAGPTVLTHHADSSLEAHCQCPVVGHETGYDEDVAVITHQVGSSFEAEHEARCDGDVPSKGTDGPLETTHTDEAASSESSEANVEPGQEASDREDSESDAPYTPELDIVFDALEELAGDGRCWVPVRQIQAQTSLRLWRLEELLEEWECMGVICRDDTRRNVAFGSSVADAFEDEYGCSSDLNDTEINTALVQSSLR